MKNLLICGFIASSIAFFTPSKKINEQRDENAISIEIVKDKLGNVNVKLWNKSNNKVSIADRPDRSGENFSINARTSRAMKFSQGTKLYWLKAKTPFLVIDSSMEGTEQIIAK